MTADSKTIEKSRLAVVVAVRYCRTHVKFVALVALLLWVPCFWHGRIEAGDLASHTYNAWLAQLAAEGKVPGIYVARQYNNVLFDLMLFYGAKVVGLRAAEKIAVAVAVQVFFWGVFALITALAKRAPWMLAPCIGMLAYGYSFHMGFMNYYLSIGLGAFAMAAVWRGGAGNWLTGAALAPFICLAHPIGFLWCVGTVAYVFLWRAIPEYWRLVLPAGVVAGLVALSSYLANHEQYDADWNAVFFLLRNGADQVILYGRRYEILSYVAAGFGAACFVAGIALRDRAKAMDWQPLRLAAELYVVALCATALLPENMRSSLYAGWIGLLSSRLTVISAIFGLAALASVWLRRWVLYGFAACAVVFAGFLYMDSGTLNALEANAEKVAEGLPFGTRIVPVMNAPEGWRVQFIGHAVERACIGRCFSVSNYEPSSGQFRVRVRQGSPVVTASADTAEEMASGEYVVRPSDLPLTAMVQCDDGDMTTVCAEALSVGRKTEHPEDPD